MKEDVKVEKQFKGRLPEGGVVIAVAKLVNYGNFKPHFSVTTDGGAAHDLILRAIPELEPIVALHLSDEDGWPMHAVANAAYHAKQEDPKSLARHLRIPVPYARDLIDEMRWYVRDAIAVEKARVADYQQRFWKEAIEACFSACWKREALAAIELLKTASGRSKTLSEDPVPGPQVIFNGDAVNPIEIEPDGHLPRIDLGGRCYYLAADEETAREAVKRYCREMQQHSPEELVCLLGEETVRSWGLGQSVKIGDHQIDNFDDWVDLASNYPQAVWASYDGQTQRLEINEALAEAAGIDFDPDEEDPIWMEVLAYQC